MITLKYPKTLHLPFSKSITNSDRMVEDGWEKYIVGKEIVITEKMDGSQSCITREGVYSRSHATFTENSWDRNLIENGGLYNQIKKYLSVNEIIYGENLYAIHSIEYNKLPNYFFMFAFRDNDIFTSWEETEQLAELIELEIVPTLFKGSVKSSNELENIINNIMNNGSKYGNTIEGVVVRNVNEFHINDFSKYVCKYVRENHVQTDKHWRKNWKRAKLVYEND